MVWLGAVEVMRRTKGCQGTGDGGGDDGGDEPCGVGFAKVTIG